MSAMLEETATVIRTEGEWLWVETAPKSACSHCSASGCSSSVIGKAFGNRRNRMRLRNTLDVQTGQQVVIGIPEQVLVSVSFRAYLAPLLTMLLFGAMAVSAGMSEILQVLFVLAGLFIGLSLAGRVGMNPASSRRYSPRLLQVLPDPGISIELTR